MNVIVDPKDTSVGAALTRALDYDGEDAAEFLKQVIRTQLTKQPELWAVGLKGYVTIPDATNMTEEMIDASRAVHLHYMDDETNGGASCESMVRHLNMGWPYTLKYLPDFMRDGGHLTKAGRAILCHSLTVAAFVDAKNFRKPPDRGQYEKLLGISEPTDAKILKRIAAEDLLAPVGYIAGESEYWLSGFTATLSYETAKGIKEVPIKCKVHPAVQIGKVKGIMVSALVARSDVPKEVRHLVKRQGTKIMFTVNQDKTILTGPYMIDRVEGNKAGRSQINCEKVDTFIVRRTQGEPIEDHSDLLRGADSQG